MYVYTYISDLAIMPSLYVLSVDNELPLGSAFGLMVVLIDILFFYFYSLYAVSFRYKLVSSTRSKNNYYWYGKNSLVRFLRHLLFSSGSDLMNWQRLSIVDLIGTKLN